MATIANNGSGYSLNGPNWYSEYIHYDTVDGSTKYGAACGFPRRSIVGGNWNNNTFCGSRSVMTHSNTARAVNWASRRGNDY